MQPLFDRLESRLGFDCTVPESGGNRDDPMQRIQWAKGRAVRIGGLPDVERDWVIVNHAEVVTYAFTANDSGHGHEGAADVVPVRSHFAQSGLPSTVWLGNEKDPADRAEARRLQALISVEARAAGYECGADWAPPKTDSDHYQVKNWASLPRYVRPV